MSKNKASRLLEQLEEEGLGNVHRVLAIHHQVLCELSGVETSQDIPERHVPKTPRRMIPEGVESPPSAGEERHATGKRVDVARDERLTYPKKPKTGENGEKQPGAKDARLAKDSRVEDARNAVDESDADRQEEEVKDAIAADEELAEEHGVEVGADHPDDEGVDGAATKRPARKKKAKKPAKIR